MFFSFGDSSCQWLIYIFFVLFWNLVESPLLMPLCSFCLILFSGHIWAGFSNGNLRRQNKSGDICQSVSHTILFISSIFVIRIFSYLVNQIWESLFYEPVVRLKNTFEILLEKMRWCHDSTKPFFHILPCHYYVQYLWLPVTSFSCS